jgi:hypothetical protein
MLATAPPIIPAPETDRVTALTLKGTATVALYRFSRALAALDPEDRRDVYGLFIEELNTIVAAAPSA